MTIAFPADFVGPGAEPYAPSREAARGLPPLLDPLIASFIDEGYARLIPLVARHGSPLNIVWPHTVARNAEAMNQVFAEHEVEREIYYGAKVNKSRALVRAAVDAGVGVDVSSPRELEDALLADADPVRICATGPAKTAGFLRELVEVGALISVDSLEELSDLEAVAAERRARILLRLRPSFEPASRFGMARDILVQGLSHVARSRSSFAFEGYHVHLASYRVETRVAAMQHLATLVDTAAELGLATRMIDIGGGLPIRYVAPDLYEAARRTHGPEDYRNAEVPAAFYPYGSDLVAADWLDTFLRAPCRSGTITTYLRDRGLRLAIEPGRSLVDQAAISIFRVTRVKPLGGDTAVIFVEGSSFSACETWFRSEFLIDPILVQAPGRHTESGSLRAYIAGHSCLEDDIVTNRWLDFPSAPRPGDLLIYANTAGYQMDLLENEFHRHPMPTRLVAKPSAGGDLVFVRDQ